MLGTFASAVADRGEAPGGIDPGDRLRRETGLIGEGKRERSVKRQSKLVTNHPVDGFGRLEHRRMYHAERQV